MNYGSVVAMDGCEVRAFLRNGHELGLVDVRPEALYAAGHPLFAICIPFGRTELTVLGLIPRRNVPIVLYDERGGELADAAAVSFRRLGYTDIRLLKGGLEGWRIGGGEVFQDVNAPSKAFGELVAHHLQTPMLAAEEVLGRIEAGAPQVILDARRYEEYRIMALPTAISLPGGELVFRARDAVPDTSTPIIVNCAGRTRSILGAQSLIHAGLPNPIFALRNGTIGWTLAGKSLEHGSSLSAPAPSAAGRIAARADAARLAAKANLPVIDAVTLAAWESEPDRTLYRLDVRDPAEFALGHLPGFRSAPGGQLVQATDEWLGVRHARVVLADDDGVRARMAGFWLKQMGWNAAVLDEGILANASQLETGADRALLPGQPSGQSIEPAALVRERAAAAIEILDISLSPAYARGHIPGARFSLPSDLPVVIQALGDRAVVLTCTAGDLAPFRAAELRQAGHDIRWLRGGNLAWQEAGLPLETGFDGAQTSSRAIDVYKRPYEGTDNPRSAMQAYLDWEFGLVSQLARDGTHQFTLL